MGRARNLLKPVTLSEAFTFPHKPYVHHLHTRANTRHAQVPGHSQSKSASSFPSIQTPQARRGSNKQSFLDGFSSKGLSRLQHLKHFHCLVCLLVLWGVHSPGAATSEGEVVSWTSFAATLGATQGRVHPPCFLNEWKKNEVNTGRRHKHILGSQASQEMPRGLAPCSLRSFFWNENQMWLLPGGGKNNTWKSEQHLLCDFQDWGTQVPPFKLEESSVWSQSQAGESELHCQPAVQSPSALKVQPPRWSTQWCPCHQNGIPTGSRLSGLSLRMPQTPCFCWASVHCGRDGNQISWQREGSSCVSYPNPIP